MNGIFVCVLWMMVSIKGSAGGGGSADQRMHENRGRSLYTQFHDKSRTVAAQSIFNNKGTPGALYQQSKVIQGIGELADIIQISGRTLAIVKPESSISYSIADVDMHTGDFQPLVLPCNVGSTVQIFAAGNIFFAAQQDRGYILIPHTKEKPTRISSYPIDDYQILFGEDGYVQGFRGTPGYHIVDVARRDLGYVLAIVNDWSRFTIILEGPQHRNDREVFVARRIPEIRLCSLHTMVGLCSTRGGNDTLVVLNKAGTEVIHEKWLGEYQRVVISHDGTVVFARHPDGFVVRMHATNDLPATKIWLKNNCLGVLSPIGRKGCIIDQSMCVPSPPRESFTSTVFALSRTHVCDTGRVEEILIGSMGELETDVADCNRLFRWEFPEWRGFRRVPWLGGGEMFLLWGAIPGDMHTLPKVAKSDGNLLVLSGGKLHFFKPTALGSAVDALADIYQNYMRSTLLGGIKDGSAQKTWRRQHSQRPVRTVDTASQTLDQESGHAAQRAQEDGRCAIQ